MNNHMENPVERQLGYKVVEFQQLKQRLFELRDPNNKNKLQPEEKVNLLGAAREFLDTMPISDPNRGPLERIINLYEIQED